MEKTEHYTASSCLKQLPMIHEEHSNYNDSANHLHGINSISSLSPARFLSTQLGRCGRFPWFLCNEVLIGRKKKKKKKIEFLITKFFYTWNYHKQFHLMIFTWKHNSQNVAQIEKFYESKILAQ